MDIYGVRGQQIQQPNPGHILYKLMTMSACYEWGADGADTCASADQAGSRAIFDHH